MWCCRLSGCAQARLDWERRQLQVSWLHRFDRQPRAWDRQPAPPPYRAVIKIHCFFSRSHISPRRPQITGNSAQAASSAHQAPPAPPRASAPRPHLLTGQRRGFQPAAWPQRRKAAAFTLRACACALAHRTQPSRAPAQRRAARQPWRHPPPPPAISSRQHSRFCSQQAPRRRVTGAGKPRPRYVIQPAWHCRLPACAAASTCRRPACCDRMQPACSLHASYVLLHAKQREVSHQAKTPPATTARHTPGSPTLRPARCWACSPQSHSRCARRLPAPHPPLQLQPVCTNFVW